MDKNIISCMLCQGKNMREKAAEILDYLNINKRMENIVNNLDQYSVVIGMILGVIVIGSVWGFVLICLRLSQK